MYNTVNVSGIENFPEKKLAIDGVEHGEISNARVTVAESIFDNFETVIFALLKCFIFIMVLL